MSRTLSFCALVAALALAAPAAVGEDAICDIPRLDRIVIDGSPADWGNGGLRVAPFFAPNGDRRGPPDLEAEFRLAWDDRGLLALFTVHDDSFAESPDKDRLSQGDAVEIFIAPVRGGKDFYQVVISPGVAPGFPELRCQVTDSRQQPELKAVPIALEAARTRIEGGYVIEALLPWKNLGLAAERGREIGVQAAVDDLDAGKRRFTAVWHPRWPPDESTNYMQPVRLADQAKGPPLVWVRADYELYKGVKAGAFAEKAFIGKTLEIRDGGLVVASAVLAKEPDHAIAQLKLPTPPPGKPFPEMEVFIGGERVGSVDTRQDPGLMRERALMWMDIVFTPYVFAEENFPRCDFKNPTEAEYLLGRYRLTTTFYDRDYHVVRKADKPGRYGAVVAVQPEIGRAFRRFVTLYRSPQPVQWPSGAMPAKIELPPGLGVDPAVTSEQAGAVREYFRELFRDAARDSPACAIFLAGLSEIPPGRAPVSETDDPRAMDRQWWVGLKRKIYGFDQRWPEAFVSPKPIAFQPAPVLRIGTPAEAGMKAEGVAAIDALCAEWAANSGEPFAVCIARRGVVVLHKAYGLRGGRPMTTEDKSDMASISKLIGGTLMMMFVHQGRVDLDKPLDEYLPPFKGAAWEKPLTLRHIFVHANNLADAVNDLFTDAEERVSRYGQYVKTLDSFNYSTAGYGLGGKVMEGISGEALPQLAKRHLFDPLGCEHTHMLTMGGVTRSCPMDIARIGQMLLNRGAYGQWRFFSEETFAKRMLPIRLTMIAGPDTTWERGIGCYWADEPGYTPRRTLTHNASSRAIFIVDLDKELVVVQTRNGPGASYNEFVPRFHKAIQDAVDSSASRSAGPTPGG